MDRREDDPEPHVIFPKHHSEDGEGDDRREGGVGSIGTGVDVGVAGLVELQHAEAGDHVHEGGVKLEVGVIRADVVTSTEHSFHHQCDAHSIEETKVFGNPIFHGKDVLGFQGSSMENVPAQDYQQEEEAQDDVAEVTENVVEGTFILGCLVCEMCPFPLRGVHSSSLIPSQSSLVPMALA